MASRNLFAASGLRLRRLWLSLGWMLVLLVVYLSVTPTPIQLPVEQGDKASHVFAYFVLMSWFANLYSVPAQRAMFALGFIVLAVTLEYVQRATGYRTFEIADMAAGTVGVAAGWLLAPPRLPNYLRWLERLCRM